MDVIGPDLSADDIRWLWSVDWYDGPLSGVVEWNGERLWAKIADEDMDERRTRKFQVVRVSPGLMAEEEKRHNLFCEHVGWHSDYRAENYGKPNTHPQTEWHKYYDVYKRPADGGADPRDVMFGSGSPQC